MKKSSPLFARVTLALSIGIAFFVAFLAIATRGSASAIQPPKGARLTPCATTRDLGQTSIRREWHVSFPIHNSGTRRLVLNAPDLDCGCSEPMQRTILVAAGETIHVDVPLDTRFATGVVESSVSFTTNDPAHPQFHLKVRALVVSEKVPGANGTLLLDL